MSESAPSSAPASGRPELRLPDKEDIIHGIELLNPVPENPYEELLYLERLCEVAGELRLWYAEVLSTRTEQIRGLETSGELVDEQYVLAPRMDETTSVDVDRLREEEPEVFSRLAFVDGSAAMRILSRERVYRLCRERVGETRIRQYERVNKTDLRREIPFGEVGRFIRVQAVPRGYAVVLRADAAPAVGCAPEEKE